MINEPPDRADAYLASMEAEERRAHAAMLEAIAAWGEVRARVAAHKGSMSGIDSALSMLDKNIRQHARQAAIPIPPDDGVAHGIDALFKRAAMAQMGAKEIVLEALQRHPGLTGAELLKKIHEEGIDLHERTFRTALYRLKVPANEMPAPGHILAVKNGWYRFEDAPPEAVENVRQARLQLWEMGRDPNATAAEDSSVQPEGREGQDQ